MYHQINFPLYRYAVTPGHPHAAAAGRVTDSGFGLKVLEDVFTDSYPYNMNTYATSFLYFTVRSVIPSNPAGYQPRSTRD